MPNLNLAQSVAIFWPVFLVMFFLYAMAIFFSTSFGLYSIIFVVFFGNTLSDYNIVPSAINSLAEITIILLFFKSLFAVDNLKNYKWYGLVPFLSFILIFLISMVLNASNPVDSILFARLYFRYYLLFIAVLNLSLDESAVKKINKFLLIIIILQLPVAFGKSLIYGVGEMAIGTYEGFHGGSQSTSLPLIVIGFSLGYYFLHKKSIFWILLAILYVVFSIVGGKRGLFFYLPFFVPFCLLSISGLRLNMTTIKLILFSGLLIMLLVSVAPLYIPTLNPDKVGKWTGDARNKGWNAVLEYAFQYNTGKTHGVTTGRVSTLLRSYEILSSGGIGTLFFGKGPAFAFESRFSQNKKGDIRKLGVGYGMTDLTRIMLQTGIAGSICYFAIPFIILIKAGAFQKRIIDSYWKAFAFSLRSFSFVMLLMAFTYTQIFMGDTISCIYFYMSAVLLRIGPIISAKKEVSSIANTNEVI